MEDQVEGPKEILRTVGCFLTIVFLLRAYGLNEHAVRPMIIQVPVPPSALPPPTPGLWGFHGRNDGR